MNFNIQILGSSSALPTYNRFPTAQIVTVHQEPFLIDCGEGTQIQLRRFNTKFGKIKNIFISHLHGDHFFGLFGLISSYNLTGRTKALNIYAHKNLEKIFNTDYSLVDTKNLNFDLIFHHLPENSQIIYEDKKMSVVSFPLKHSIETCGFKFIEKKLSPNIRKEKITELGLSISQILQLKKGLDIKIEDVLYKNSELTIAAPEPRTYAFCSDTAYAEEIIRYIENVDLLYHEATFLSKEKETALLTRHSTATQAAEIAKKAKVKSLIIGHFSSRYKFTKPYLVEAKALFGNVFLAYDGLEIEIDNKHNINNVSK